MVDLPPTCDRCGPAVRAHWLWLNPNHELALCDHHDREHHDALVAQGFDRYQLAVPDLRQVGSGAVHG
jgi:hypothetical protein